MLNYNDLNSYVTEFINKLKSLEESNIRLDGQPYDDELKRILIVKGIETFTNETLNRDMINWRRVRSLIEHENNLINYRMTWLLSSQGGRLCNIWYSFKCY